MLKPSTYPVKTPYYDVVNLRKNNPLFSSFGRNQKPGISTHCLGTSLVKAQYLSPAMPPLGAGVANDQCITMVWADSAGDEPMIFFIFPRK